MICKEFIISIRKNKKNADGEFFHYLPIAKG